MNYHKLFTLLILLILFGFALAIQQLTAAITQA